MSHHREPMKVSGSGGCGPGPLQFLQLERESFTRRETFRVAVAVELLRDSPRSAAPHPDARQCGCRPRHAGVSVPPARRGTAAPTDTHILPGGKVVGVVPGPAGRPAVDPDLRGAGSRSTRSDATVPGTPGHGWRTAPARARVQDAGQVVGGVVVEMVGGLVEQDVRRSSSHANDRRPLATGQFAGRPVSGDASARPRPARVAAMRSPSPRHRAAPLGREPRCRPPS